MSNAVESGHGSLGGAASGREESLRRALLASRPRGARRAEAGLPERTGERVVGVEAESPRSDARTLAGWIDHTILLPEATEADIRRVAREAREAGCASTCVNGRFVPVAAEELIGSRTVVCAVVGFPLGAMPPGVKAFEASWVVERGAKEVDMVLALGDLKGGNDYAVWHEIHGVREAVGDDVRLKVILETGLLEDGEKVVAAQIAVAAGADFVKTSTGFGHGGATVEDVRLLRAAVGEDVGVKASGGIASYEDAVRMLAAGADRLGMSRTLAVLAEAEQATARDMGSERVQGTRA